jgi:hypothetical protein
MRSLLAVDLGLKTGLALFGEDGRLRWHRSRHFGSAPRLRRAVYRLLHGLPELAWLVLEGGGPLAEIWEREAQRRQVPVRRISAEVWRRRFLYPRERRNGRQAKLKADDLARRVIKWSQVPGATSLQHDTAEAILVGLWGVLNVGWLEALPAELRR